MSNFVESWGFWKFWFPKFLVIAPYDFWMVAMNIVGKWSVKLEIGFIKLGLIEWKLENMGKEWQAKRLMILIEIGMYLMCLIKCLKEEIVWKIEVLLFEVH